MEYEYRTEAQLVQRRYCFSSCPARAYYKARCSVFLEAGTIAFAVDLQEVL